MGDIMEPLWPLPETTNAVQPGALHSNQHGQHFRLSKKLIQSVFFSSFSPQSLLIRGRETYPATTADEDDVRGQLFLQQLRMGPQTGSLHPQGQGLRCWASSVERVLLSNAEVLEE